MLLDLSLGAPAGGGIGLGVESGGWRAMAQGGVIGAAFVGMFSASVHVHHDVATWGAVKLAVGGEATRAWYMMGSDEVEEGSFDTIGPTLQLRRSDHHRIELVLDAGPLVGRCRSGCNVRLFVMPAATARFVVKF